MLLAKRSLDKQVCSIVKSYGGSEWVPDLTSCFQDSAGTTPCTIDSPVGYLKDGTNVNHATQATSGFRPILRGKVKNFLLNSATLSTQTVSNTATTGIKWVLSFEGTGTVTVSGGYVGSLVGSTGRVSLAFTTTASTNITCTVSGTVTNAQLERGDVASQYIPTTSAAVSSSYGPYWLDFDGTDDRLATGNMTSAVDTVVCAYASYDTAANQDLIGKRSGSSGYLLRTSSGPTRSGFVGNGTTMPTYTNAAASYGEHVIVSMLAKSGANYYRENGVKLGDITVTFADSNSALVIGGTPTTNGYNLSKISAVFRIPGQLTENQLRKIEKYAANLHGVLL